MPQKKGRSPSRYRLHLPPDKEVQQLSNRRSRDKREPNSLKPNEFRQDHSRGQAPKDSNRAPTKPPRPLSEHDLRKTNNRPATQEPETSATKRFQNPVSQRHKPARGGTKNADISKQSNHSQFSTYRTASQHLKQVATPKNKPSPHEIGSSNNSVSLMHTHRLRRDGRKTPDEFKQTIMAKSSPSQLSVKSLSEHYNVPDKEFNSPEDVFRYRGYKKMDKIDEGAFGIVSKAMRLSDKIIVAVKEVDLRRKRVKRIEEMKRELFVLQKIDSPHIVKLIEHFIVSQTLVIIMEFCAGSNLTTYLKKTAIDEEEAISLFRQMAVGIKVLHRKGIAHRDVKLNNFLLDGSRTNVKVGDFGLSVVSYRHAQGIMMAKTYCGTEPYMAPEILRRNSMGMRCYNPLYADIWSLGICLFAMLTRTFPFKMHLSQRGMFRAQVTRRWRFPKTIKASLSEELKDLVWHMLDPEPERRITINGVLAHPWINRGQMVELSADENDLGTP